MTSTSIESCLEQIGLLTEKYNLVIDQNNELHATNQQLLRQHEAQKTTLIIVTETLERAGMPLLNINPVTVETPVTKRNATPHKRCSKTLDGNSPIKLISKQLGEELEAQQRT